MKKAKISAVLAVAVAATTMFSACGGGTLVGDPTESGSTADTASAADSAADSAAQQEVATAGDKTVTVALPKAWDSMMPLNTNSNYSRMVYDQIYDRLVMENADGSYTPRLATSWDVNADSTAVTFHLAENVTWQDGEPFTADDVVFSFQMYSDPEVEALSRYYLQYIDGVDDAGAELSADSINVKADDANTVTITMKSAMYADTLLSNLNMVFMVPKHLLDGKTAAELNSPETWATPVGTGPFIYESEVSGERMELAKNPNYFQGAPDIDRLVIRVVDNASLLANMMSGEVDVNVSSSMPLQDWPMALEQDNLNCTSSPSTSYNTFIMNESKSYLTQNVRQAINMAINRSTLVDAYLQGEGQTIVTPFSTLSPYYDAEIPVWYDPDKAKTMLEEENFPFDTELQFYTASGTDNERIATLISQDLEKIGLKVQIVQVDFATLMSTMRDGNFDFGTIGSGGTMDPSESREMIAPDSSVNFAHVPDTTLADMVDAANAALTIEERKPLFNAYQQALVEDSPMAYLYTKNYLIACSKRITNVDPSNFSNMNWSIWTWKVEG